MTKTFTHFPNHPPRGSWFTVEFHTTWPHTAHPNKKLNLIDFNYLSPHCESQSSIKSHVTWAHTAYLDFLNLTLHEPTQRITILSLSILVKVFKHGRRTQQSWSGGSALRRNRHRFRNIVAGFRSRTHVTCWMSAISWGVGLIGHAGPSSEIFAFLSSWTFRINTLVLINMVLYNANYVIMSDHEYFMALNSILICIQWIFTIPDQLASPLKFC